MDTPYYIFYADEFIKNYHELENAFRNIYPYYQIAYSFKTNYVPAVCQIVKQLGGYAEVVSDMEYTLAKRVGFPDKKIIYNGPGKGIVATECLLNSGHLHIDNGGDIKRVLSIARKNRNKQFKVGVRVNFDIDNGLHSRFGFDIDNGDFKNVIDILNAENNVAVSGLHFHISRARGLRDWKKRIDKVLEISDDLFDYILDYIDIGSGMFGHLDQVLLEQFGNPPSYTDYMDGGAVFLLQPVDEVQAAFHLVQLAGVKVVVVQVAPQGGGKLLQLVPQILRLLPVIPQLLDEPGGGFQLLP